VTAWTTAWRWATASAEDMKMRLVEIPIIGNALTEGDGVGLTAGSKGANAMMDL
jgi:hypothetical protein